MYSRLERHRILVLTIVIRPAQHQTIPTSPTQSIPMETRHPVGGLPYTQIVISEDMDYCQKFMIHMPMETGTHANRGRLSNLWLSHGRTDKTLSGLVVIKYFLKLPTLHV